MNAVEHRRTESRGEVLVASEAVEAYTPAWFTAPHANGDDALRGGRGNVRIVNSAIGPLVYRGYLRGGLPRHLVRDRYLWLGADRTRAFREFRLMRRLRALGLPIPAPIAARYQRSGLLYRADLLTRLIPDARRLADVLAEPASEDTTVLDDVASTIASLHRQAVWHADLNASNVLIDAAGKVWLIDFDRAQEGVRSPERLTGNLDRLLRSLRKLLTPQRIAAIQQLWPRFVSTYQRALG